MGCDIHFYVEKWSDEEVNEGPIDISDVRDRSINEVFTLKKDHRWVTADKWIKEDDDYWTNYRTAFYRGRNYDLFAKLADVRNSDRIIPLSEPRGVPIDASYAYKLMVQEMNGDGHSHSCFTLNELLDSGIDWSEFSNDFLNTIEKMKKVDPDPSKVRCVFFFDN